jgi:hypothetical protein
MARRKKAVWEQGPYTREHFVEIGEGTTADERG